MARRITSGWRGKALLWTVIAGGWAILTLNRHGEPFWWGLALTILSAVGGVHEVLRAKRRSDVN